MGNARDVVVFATDDRRAEFLANVIYNLIDVGVTEIITVGRHQSSCGHAMDKYPNAVRCCVYTSYLNNHQGVHAWAVSENNVFILWLMRYKVVHDMLKEGFSVLISDSDMWYAQNPFPVLRSDALGKHTVVANTEGELFPSMNGGLQYFRHDVPGNGSDHLLSLFTNHVEDLVSNPPERCLNGRPFHAPMMDQDILRDAAESAVAGVPLWFSLTHDPCRFSSWEEREKSRLEVRDKYPELKWNNTGLMLKRPHAAHPDVEKHAGRLEGGEERYVRMKVPGFETWSNITIVQAPKWMFANHGDTDGWLALTPRASVVFHAMSIHQGIKPRLLRAYNMWHWDDLGIGRDRRASTGRWLSIANADMRFKTRGEFARQVARLAALAAATKRTPVLPMLPCDSEWLAQFQCSHCYAGVIERVNLLAGTCPVTAERQYQPWFTDRGESLNAKVGVGGAVGSPCCYFVPPGDHCSEEWQAWGMEMTPPDSSGGAELRPTMTVKVSALIAAAGLGDDTADLAKDSWVRSDFEAPKSKGPTDVLLSSGKVRKELMGGALDMPGWAEIDLEGGNVLPRVVSSSILEDSSPALDVEARGWFNAYSSHCPEHNEASPVH